MLRNLLALFMLLPVCLYGQSNCDYPEPTGFFIRGDANNDGSVDLVTDWLYLSNFLWSSGPPPCNPDAADVNDDGLIDLSDQVALQNWWLGQFSIPEPYPEAGDDETGDFLAAETSPKPGGDGFKPGMTAREAGEAAVPPTSAPLPAVGGGSTYGKPPGFPEARLFDRTDTTHTNYGASGDWNTRLLSSENIACHPGAIHHDWFTVSWKSGMFDSESDRFKDDKHKGHVSKWELDNYFIPEYNPATPGVAIRVRLNFNIESSLDCGCAISTTPSSQNYVKVSLGLPVYGNCGLVVYLKNMTHPGKDWVLEYTIDNLSLFNRTVQWDDYSGQCTGNGLRVNNTLYDFCLNGRNVNIQSFTQSGANPTDIMKIDKIEIDGIVHMAGINTGVEISQFDVLRTRVKCSVKYEWRKSKKDPCKEQF